MFLILRPLSSVAVLLATVIVVVLYFMLCTLAEAILILRLGAINGAIFILVKEHLVVTWFNGRAL